MSTNRHLLCIYPWLELGGADKFNLDMLGCLADHGWRATIVTTRPSLHPWRDEFEQVTDDIVDLTVYPPEQYPQQLLQTIQARPIDCVLISCSSEGYALLPYLRAHFPHITFVDYCHMVEAHWRDGGYPRMSLQAADALDQQIVSSHGLKQWMCERGGDSERIVVCTTNIDTTLWDPAHYDRQELRAQLGIPMTAPVLLYAARLERQKQPLKALSVMKQVAAQARDAHFLVAGDGRFASGMRDFLRWHGLESRVHMLGAVRNRRVRELLALSDLLFLPSETEGIALVVYEAMAMGVVPISASVGGQAELITPACGVLVPPQPRVSDVYAEEILRLLDDPARMRRMGMAARQRVANHFGLEKMSVRINDLLTQAQALHETSARPPISADAVRAAECAAVASARRASVKTVRRRLRARYWQMANRLGWWLIALVEKIREPIQFVRSRHHRIARSAARVARVSRH